MPLRAADISGADHYIGEGFSASVCRIGRHLRQAFALAAFSEVLIAARLVALIYMSTSSVADGLVNFAFRDIIMREDASTVH